LGAGGFGFFGLTGTGVVTTASFDSSWLQAVTPPNNRTLASTTALKRIISNSSKIQEIILDRD
jgi:hypothetical protein